MNEVGTATIDQLIITSPYEEPKEHWKYDRETRRFTREPGRRPAGYVRASEASKSFDDPGEFVELPLVNQIRPRVKAWREADYPGATGITKRLLKHWYDPEMREGKRFFFCQLEAIETLMWLAEAPEADRVGIKVPGDGGEFARQCAKMATGSGKTIVMAMLIAWQVLNKVTYPQDKKYSKNILVIAPGLTVRKRLEVLVPGSTGNYYQEFQIIPPGLEDKLRQGQSCRVLVRNWHMLDWESEEQITKRRSVDKRGALSDEAYVRDVLGEMHTAENILVINDEAHHAWRVPPKVKVAGISKDELKEATKWIGGLDRIHKARTILMCYDLTATPFAPTGRKSGEETLFRWIVSDFGLNDAIESGLVKTPRVVVRDDGELTAKYKSKFYHIYSDPEVKPDLNRKAEPHTPLPDLVRKGYYFLGKDWLEAAKKWHDEKRDTPPVMITVANTTYTAARVEYAFQHRRVLIEELCEPETILHIDSKVLDEAEAQVEAVELKADAATTEAAEEDAEENAAEENGAGGKKKLSKKDRAELLRKTVDTVGQPGQPGARVQNVISVGMLSEGWDAKTVTHIMGLRAFTSQLLCEQVVGRGLRRTSYDVDEQSGLFRPEYVNIFGVPFTFLPHEGSADAPPPPPPSGKTRIEPIPERRAQYEIAWPNIIRIDHEYKPVLKLDMDKLRPLVLDVYKNPRIAELAPMIDGKPDFTKLKDIDLDGLAQRYRMQRIVFQVASEVYDTMEKTWKGNREYLLAQLVRLVERYIEAGGVRLDPPIFNNDDKRRRLVLTMDMTKIVQHLWEAIRYENALTLEPIFDSERPIRSTGDMLPWYTGKACEHTKRSHINMCVYDSRWEANEALELDRNHNVRAWVKNDHLGFEITYSFKGIIHKFRPDYLIKLTNGTTLVLEVKGMDDQQNQTKRVFLAEWVQAVNTHGGFGKWAADVSRHPKDVLEILERHNTSLQPVE
ncbi:MAG TPA: DEAD/DEAH box helicase family protein [Candidatus Angelobacter sp.]|nr:DEAD/DEAH box helicase family protein [Candidatus Angelobacter sp.]